MDIGLDDNNAHFWQIIITSLTTVMTIFFLIFIIIMLLCSAYSNSIHAFFSRGLMNNNN